MITALDDICRRLMALVAGILVVSVTLAAAQLSTRIVTESYLIPSDDPGIQLYVRNKRPSTMTTFRADRTVLYVHGTTQASETTFDLALDGKSWMDYIAEQGWDVWLMNVRGFGGSTKPPEMDRPAADSPPIAPAVVAMRDVRVAVGHILGKRGLSRISLLGWSRGAESGGLVCQRASGQGSPPRSLCAGVDPQSVPGRRTARADPGLPDLEHGAGPYAPPGRCPVREAGNPIPFRVARRLGGRRPGHGSGRRRADAASGAQPRRTAHDDGREYWNAGKPLYDPARITAPTLIVTAEWDGA